MTTAHRATWYTARGHEEQGGARVFAPSKMRSKLDAPGDVDHEDEVENERGRRDGKFNEQQ